MLLEENNIIHDATYPREGTETTSSMTSLSGGIRCNLSPRGDGNGSCFVEIIVHSRRCNLSPRGDGNAKVGPLFTVDQKMQLIPARGRKPYIQDPPNFFYGMQLIPARGRKPFGLTSAMKLSEMMQLIPARGRKPPDSGRRTSPGGRCNLSPRGDGNVAILFPSVNFLDATYPREGTETYHSRVPLII